MLLEITDPLGNPKLHCCDAFPCDRFLVHRNVKPKQVRARVRVRVRTLPLALTLTLALTQP